MVPSRDPVYTYSDTLPEGSRIVAAAVPADYAAALVSLEVAALGLVGTMSRYDHGINPGPEIEARIGLCADQLDRELQLRHRLRARNL